MADDNWLEWYFSQKEIEENSPSRRDGIDLKKETYLRKSYCTFLQDLGMELKLSQVIIATAIIYCHRFYVRQSHAKNDYKTVATACMFLAAKVEESPRPLHDVILVSYEIMHKRDPSAIEKIKQKEVYEQQKEFILLGERLLLTTLGFDIFVFHPYLPLVQAIKKLTVAQNALAQLAWNFVNDVLRTSLCLQFKPKHIAAGAVFLAAKFLKVRLPTESDRFWRQDFDVTPWQLEEVSNRMLEMYEQNRASQSSAANEASTSGGTNNLVATISTNSEDSVAVNSTQDAGVVDARHVAQVPPPATQISDDRTADTRSKVWDQNMDTGCKDCSLHEVGTNTEESLSCSNSSMEQPMGDVVIIDKGKTVETREWKEGDFMAFSDGCWSSSHGGTAKEEYYCPSDAITKIDKDKVGAALEKRRWSRTEVAKKTDLTVEDDIIERELDSGNELAAKDDRLKAGETERDMVILSPHKREQAEDH